MIERPFLTLLFCIFSTNLFIYIKMTNDSCANKKKIQKTYQERYKNLSEEEKNKK